MHKAPISNPRAPKPSVAYSHGAVPSKGTDAASAVPLNLSPKSTTGTRASGAVPIGHGPSSATGTRANSVVPLSRGINSAMGGRVSNAAPLNHGKGACASGAAPPGHASRNNTDAATARRSLTRKCSPSPRSDRVATVGLRCGKASSKTPPSGHEVAVGLRCGKANTTTPSCLARLNPVFLATVAGALSFFPSRRSRQDQLPRSPPPRGLMEQSLLGWDLSGHPPVPRFRRRIQGLQALLRLHAR